MFRAMEQVGISAAAREVHGRRRCLDEWRTCGDFRNLNLRTITDSYVIPNLHSLNFQLKGKQVFSRLDLVKDYFQVPVNKASRD